MPQVTIEKAELSYDVNEAMKVLRTNLTLNGKNKKVFMLTSTTQDEGKSTVSLNLCQSLGQVDSKVLLIDADMRKSVLAHKVSEGEVGYNGLSYFLVGRLEADDIIYNTNIKNVDVIFAGRVPPNPSELLSSARMEWLIEQCRQNYDYVIVDAPPLNLVVDAAVIAPMCDGTVMVVKSGEIPHKIVQDVVDELEDTGTPIIGVILNAVDRSNAKYDSYYKGYYKKYYNYSHYYENDDGKGKKRRKRNEK